MVVGFYPAYYSGISPTPEQLEKLTYVIIFSVQVPPDGNITEQTIAADLNGGSRVVALIDDASKKGVGVMLAVGGDGKSQGFSSMTGSATARKLFINNLLAFCVKYGFAGVDIDWEFPNSGNNDRANFTLFARELKAAFGPKGMVISIDVNGTNAQYYNRDTFDHFDWLNLMAYDNDWPVGSSHHSTYAHAQQSIDLYSGLGVPKNKLVLGVPFYGKSYGGTKSYGEILAANPGLDASQDSDKGFYFNGPTTIGRKTTLAMDQGTRGIMIWELLQDASDNRLLQSISNTIQNKGGILDQKDKPVVSVLPIKTNALHLLQLDGGFWTLGLSSGTGRRLTLFSPSGRILHTLLPDQTSNGVIRWHAPDMPEGRYLFRVDGGPGQEFGAISGSMIISE